MPRKVIDGTDLERGLRFMEERKKIWKSRDDFGNATGLSPRTLQNWESKGAEIPSTALKAISLNGGDVVFILTGKRRRLSISPDAQASPEIEGFSRFSECVGMLAQIGELSQANDLTRRLWSEYIESLRQELQDALKQMQAQSQSESSEAVG